MGEPVTDLDERQRRQRERTRVMALLLGGFVILMFFITLAKVQFGK